MVKLLIELQALDFGFLAKLPDGKKLAITNAETLQGLIAELVKELGEKVLKSVKEGTTKPNVLHTVYIEVGSSDDTALDGEQQIQESSSKLMEKLKNLSATQKYQVENALRTIIGEDRAPKTTSLGEDKEVKSPSNNSGVILPKKETIQSPSANTGARMTSDKPGQRNLG